MQMVAAGDDRARRMLAVRVIGLVRKVAHALLRPGMDADDAAQQSLLAIMRSAGTYQGNSSLERWTRRIAVRHTLRVADAGRRRRSRIDASIDPDATQAVFGASSLVDSLPRPLQAYLDELPDRRRQALVLRHALGYSTAEIAELTGTPQSTVKYHVRTALEDIRRTIRREALVGSAPEALR